MQKKAHVVATGLAMFSMFFGSGNLVFPLLVGQLSQGHTILSTIGILITGVLVPFLGTLAMLLFNGDTNEFFSRFGKKATFCFSLFALGMMGPFGVLARCITVAHGAFCLLLPSTSLWLFSLASCTLLFFLTIRKRKIVSIIGSILTPLLLLSIGAIALFGLMDTPTIAVVEGSSSWDAFKLGIFQGYQTMDLLAAFFFSTFVINHLRQNRCNESTLKTFFRSSLIGIGLLSAVYIALVLLGANYSSRLSGIPEQELLGRVAQLALGPYAAPIVCAAVILACITTAVVLTSLFAEFLKKEVAKEKISLSLSLVTTLGIGFFVSTLEFAGIMKFIGPILAAIYPSLIVMTLLSIAYKTVGWRAIRTPTAIALALKLLFTAV